MAVKNIHLRSMEIRLNRKFEQKLKLLLADQDFQAEVVALRKKFKSLVDKAIEVAEKYASRKTAEDVTRATAERLVRESREVIQRLVKEGSMKKKGGPNKFGEELGKLEMAHRHEVAREMSRHLERYAAERDALFSEPGFHAAVRDLADRYSKKYKLTPRDVWYTAIANYVVFEKTGSPWEFSAPPEALIPIFTDTEQLLKLRGYNFGVTVLENKETGEPELYVRIFDTTSRDDVVDGWGAIEKIRTAVMGKQRHYPLGSLPLHEKIAKADKELGAASDWQKINYIHGDTSDFKLEDKRMKQVRQTRHIYKKRFRTES